MKIVKEILYENNMHFTEHDKDPIKSMGIGRKTTISKWLSDIQISDYRLTKKFEINVYNSVFIDSRKLDELPEYIKFNHIMGGFHINKNSLRSLRGCPYSVSGSFMASNNFLTSLEHSPIIVKESYGVSYNDIESLEGLAEIIGRGIYLNNNKLKNLKYLPHLVHGDLNISKNPIETLEYFPKEVEGNLQFTPSEILTKENISSVCKVWGHLIEIL
jgi:hypothetical protein